MLYDQVSAFWGKAAFFPQAEDQLNMYRIGKYDGTFRTASIFFKGGQRAKEGLVNELLHLELYRLGYPFFTCQKDMNPEFVSPVNNNIQHQVMLPLFLKSRFGEDLFESDRNELADYEKEIINKIESFATYNDINSSTVNSKAVFLDLGIEVRFGTVEDLGRGGTAELTSSTDLTRCLRAGTRHLVRLRVCPPVGGPASRQLLRGSGPRLGH